MIDIIVEKQNPIALECEGVSENVRLLHGFELHHINPKHTIRQQETNAKGRVFKEKSGVWCDARRIRNEAILRTVMNSANHAAATTCKASPTVSRLNELFTFDFQAGKIFTKKPRGRMRKGDLCGTIARGYIQVYADYVAYRAHRLMWKAYYHSEPKGYIDHIDGNPSNNCIYNLRDVLPVENSRNRHGKVRSNSGVRGVSWCLGAKRWMACIGANERTVHLGTYLAKECAIKARKHAEKILFLDVKGGA